MAVRRRPPGARQPASRRAGAGAPWASGCVASCAPTCRTPATRSCSAPTSTAAMRRLSARDQEVLELHLWEGLESREIAEVLGLTTAVVRPRLSRARAQAARPARQRSGTARTSPQQRPRAAGRRTRPEGVVMIPKLTDDAVAELPLGAGRAELLEEIMTTVAPDRPDRAARPVRNRGPAGWRPLAVAAAVAAVASTPLWWGGGQDGSGRGPDRRRRSLLRSRRAPASARCSTAPGWEVDHVEGTRSTAARSATAKAGCRSRSRGTRQSSYERYVEDRGHILARRRTGSRSTVLGKAGPAVGLQRHRPHRDPRADQEHWMEIRAAGMDKAGYVALLDQLRLVSLAELRGHAPGRVRHRASDPLRSQAILDGIAGGDRRDGAGRDDARHATPTSRTPTSWAPTSPASTPAPGSRPYETRHRRPAGPGRRGRSASSAPRASGRC